MGREYDGDLGFAPQFVEEREHDLTRRGVEVPGGLVEQQESRAMHERSRQSDALLLAAGELGGEVTRAVAQSDTREEARHACVVAPTAERERQSDVLLRREIRHEVEGLEDDADALATQRDEIR